MKDLDIINDERYVSESSHVTFTRFKKGIRNGIEYGELIDRLFIYELWKENISHIELVEHDWYNISTKKRIIFSSEI